MPLWLKATGKWGSIFVLIALVIAFVKQLIALVTTIMFAIKAVVFLAFIAVFLGVGYLIFRSWKENQRRKNES